MSVLVDTNVLLRRTQPAHEDHSAAVEAVAHFLSGGEIVYFTMQNIAEFWNVATRPASHNGFGLSADATLAEVQKIERTLTYLPDALDLYREWKRLVIRHAVVGVKVHNARLVAAMNIHGVRRLLTFDKSDFSRYGIDVIHPSSLLSAGDT